MSKCSNPFLYVFIYVFRYFFISFDRPFRYIVLIVISLFLYVVMCWFVMLSFVMSLCLSSFIYVVCLSSFLYFCVGVISLFIYRCRSCVENKPS